MDRGDRIGLLPEPTAFDQGRHHSDFAAVVSETKRDQVAAWDNEESGLDEPAKQAVRRLKQAKSGAAVETAR